MALLSRRSRRAPGSGRLAALQSTRKVSNSQHACGTKENHSGDSPRAAREIKPHNALDPKRSTASQPFSSRSLQTRPKSASNSSRIDRLSKAVASETSLSGRNPLSSSSKHLSARRPQSAPRQHSSHSKTTDPSDKSSEVLTVIVGTQDEDTKVFVSSRKADSRRAAPSSRSASSRISNTLMDRKVKARAQKHRIEELGHHLYLRMYEKGMQKHGAVGDSFQNDFELNEFGQVSFEAFWKVVQKDFDGTVSEIDARAVFDLADTDKDGSISLNEMHAAYSKTDGVEGVEYNDGVLGGAERDPVATSNSHRKKKTKPAFVDKVLNRIRGTYNGRASLMEAFRTIDQDHNGYISEVEMQQVLKGLDIDATLADVGFLYEYFDDDNNGKLKYAEFIDIVLEKPSEDTQAIEERKKQNVPEGLKELQGLRKRLTDAGISIEDDKPKHMTVDEISSALREVYRRRAGLREVFRDWDEDKNGHVSKNEMSQILHYMGINVTSKDFHALYSRFDADGEHGIAYDEFVDFVYPSETTKDKIAKQKKDEEKHRMRVEAERIKNVTPGTLEESLLIQQMKRNAFARLSQKGKGTLKEAFQKFDTDRNGVLTYDEFREGMRSLDDRLTDAHIDVLLLQFDKDLSGSIDYTEFVENVSNGSGGDGFFSRNRSRFQSSNLSSRASSRTSTVDGLTLTGGKGPRNPRPVTANLEFAREILAGRKYHSKIANVGAVPRRPLTSEQKKRGRFIVPSPGTFREQNFAFKELYSKVTIPTKRENTPMHDTQNLIRAPSTERFWDTLEHQKDIHKRSLKGPHHHAFYPGAVPKELLRPLSRHTGKRNENVEQAQSDVAEARRWGRQKRRQENEARVYARCVLPNRYGDLDRQERRVRSSMRQNLLYLKSLEHRFEADAAVQMTMGFKNKKGEKE
jgi:Ca2+-binding EF-hand superfamily protein